MFPAQIVFAWGCYGFVILFLTVIPCTIPNNFTLNPVFLPFSSIAVLCICICSAYYFHACMYAIHLWFIKCILYVIMPLEHWLACIIVHTMTRPAQPNIWNTFITTYEGLKLLLSLLPDTTYVSLHMHFSFINMLQTSHDCVGLWDRVAPEILSCIWYLDLCWLSYPQCFCDFKASHCICLLLSVHYTALALES